MTGPRPRAPRDPMSEARAAVAHVRAALELAPALVEIGGWREIEAQAGTMPACARSGFLTHHPFDIACTEALLGFDRADLAPLPAPLQSALACAAFRQLLALSGWNEGRAEQERLTRAIEAATYLKDPASRARFEARLAAVEARLKAPAVPDGLLEVPGLPRVRCSLAGSVGAFRALASSQRPGAPWILSFGHPFSLWLAARDAYDTAFARSPDEGKWNVHVPTLAAAVRAALALVPAFERGAARLGKILLTEAAVEGYCLVLYAAGPEEPLRRALDAAAGARSFFVYDSDCGEGAALRRIVRLVARTDVGAPAGRPPPSPDQARRIDAAFGAAIELSDVQRQILRTALAGGVTPFPGDAWTRLVLTYLDGLGAEVASLPDALADPALIARVGAEARALQSMERARTGIPPRAI